MYNSHEAEHIYVEKNLPTIKNSYQKILDGLPSTLQPLASNLPVLLGLVEKPEQGWEGFIRLAPNRNLPCFAMKKEQNSDRLNIDSIIMEQFCVAHHYGGFYGILNDRIADKQVMVSRKLLLLKRYLLEAWKKSLEEATKDNVLVSSIIRSVLYSWKRGVEKEQRALQDQKLSIRTYTRNVCDKLKWIRASTICLLIKQNQTDHINSFCLIHNLFLLSLQCLDDAYDAKEDQRIQGSSIASALGFPAKALIEASLYLTQLGESLAFEKGFYRFADWFKERLFYLETIIDQDQSFQSCFAGFIIVESIRSEMGLTPNNENGNV